MTITLTDVEVAALELQRQGEETVEDVLHRHLQPLLGALSEKELRELAEKYRAMSREDQLSIVQDARAKVSEPVEPIETDGNETR